MYEDFVSTSTGWISKNNNKYAAITLAWASHTEASLAVAGLGSQMTVDSETWSIMLRVLAPWRVCRLELFVLSLMLISLYFVDSPNLFIRFCEFFSLFLLVLVRFIFFVFWLCFVGLCIYLMTLEENHVTSLHEVGDVVWKLLREHLEATSSNEGLEWTKNMSRR